MAKVKRLTEKPHIVLRMVFRVAAVLYVIFCVTSIVVTQNGIVEKKQELAAIEADIEIIKSENEELQAIKDSDDLGAYMAKQAMENKSYSYAYPDERRYYDKSRD